MTLTTAGFASLGLSQPAGIRLVSFAPIALLMLRELPMDLDLRRAERYGLSTRAGIRSGQDWDAFLRAAIERSPEDWMAIELECRETGQNPWPKCPVTGCDHAEAGWTWQAGWAHNYKDWYAMCRGNPGGDNRCYLPSGTAGLCIAGSHDACRHPERAHSSLDFCRCPCHGGEFWK